MTKVHLVRPALIALLACASFLSVAQVAVPPLQARVNDLTATLSVSEKATLEQTLQAFEAKKGSQFALLIVSTTAPETIEQYALRVVDLWKLGRTKVDDGAILVVAKNDRAVRIEVGYGLEGALNDATSKRIISDTILPRFQANDFYGGISAGVEQIIRVVDGEPLPAPKTNARGNIGSIQQYIPVIFILALIVGGALRAVLGKVPSAIVTGGAVAIGAWLFAGAISVAVVSGVIALAFTLLSGGISGRALSGHRGGFYGGFGGGLGGVGVGGFGGGGGGFGGGGASGRW